MPVFDPSELIVTGRTAWRPAPGSRADEGIYSVRMQPIRETPKGCGSRNRMGGTWTSRERWKAGCSDDDVAVDVPLCLSRIDDAAADVAASAKQILEFVALTPSDGAL